jgi:CBS domain containing-hemolysin-like protein
MIPLERCTVLLSSQSSKTAEETLKKNNTSLGLVSNKAGRILGYVHAWDLIENKSVGSLNRTATFIEAETTIIDLVFRLKKDSSSIAFVLDSGGNVSGIVTLEAVVGEITRESEMKQALSNIEKTIPADMLVNDFIKRYQVILPETSVKTFRELAEELLGHKPSVGDIVCFGPIEITVKEVSMRGAKTILIETID